MNRYTLLIALFLASAGAKAQDVWEKPDSDDATEQTVRNGQQEKKVRDTENKDAKYMAGAVPEKDGKVVWTFSFNVPGRSAQEIYDVTLKRMKAFTKQENQLEGSAVALVNKKEHSIVVTAAEWMVFRDSFLSLDRAKFFYTLIFNITDGHIGVSMERLYYRYDDNNGRGEYKISAEESISDRNGLNKKQTKLVPGWAKFRRKTVDRAGEVEKYIRKIGLQLAKDGNGTTK